MIMISIALVLLLTSSVLCGWYALQRRRLLFLLGVPIVAINAMSLSWQIRVARVDRLRAAAAAECAGAPKVVPYRDGMTLCPGQSTVVIVPVPLDLVPFDPEPDRGI